MQEDKQWYEEIYETEVVNFINSSNIYHTFIVSFYYSVIDSFFNPLPVCQKKLNRFHIKKKPNNQSLQYKESLMFSNEKWCPQNI